MKIALLILTLLLLCGCAPASEAEIPSTMPEAIPETTQEVTVPETTAPPDPIQEHISRMTVEERVGQLFLARCDASVALDDIVNYHLGGFVLFAADTENETPDSLREKIASYQANAQIPLLIAVDEEGGLVNRVSKFKTFRENPFPAPRTVFETQGYGALLEIETEKCRFLRDFGFNVNLGPVCDITTDPAAFMYQRSLGQAPSTVGRFVMDTVAIMSAYHMGSVLKHFPGYGNNADTHTGIARDIRPLEELENCDLIPFRSGISAGADAILVSHTFVEAFDSEIPASLSPAVHRYLRQDLGFAGVIVTDDLVMQAITDLYGAGEAAVLAVLAGNDLLCSTDYRTQYDAVLDAVASGRIDTDTLNAAVRNVLQWKLELGLI